MTANNLNKIRKLVCSSKPLIHAITNPISITQCANAILSVGAQTIMAEHPKEVGEITEVSNALLLNLGNITDARMESMLISAETAHKNNIPFVIDVVGVACSTLRREYAVNLIEKFTPSVIKGNYSEITALFDTDYRSMGVDTDTKLTTSNTMHTAVHLAKRYNSVVLASGETDIITDGKRIFLVKNGTHQLSRITGTGCMLGSLCATYLSTTPPIDAAVCSCTVLGICGELSETHKGNGTFFCGLLDSLSTLTDTELEKYLRLEKISIETH